MLIIQVKKSLIWTFLWSSLFEVWTRNERNIQHNCERLRKYLNWSSLNIYTLNLLTHTEFCEISLNFFAQIPFSSKCHSSMAVWRIKESHIRKDVTQGTADNNRVKIHRMKNLPSEVKDPTKLKEVKRRQFGVTQEKSFEWKFISNWKKEN